ncbi:hypothetical protein THRCLA_00623 [Thraustotheca clavata]|uniref:Uncharacterized protein n=1 Tax=Thraustotheca clavata TaxID=74557 RepID=A0A1W0AAP8_9STRA|nr:hypothetical protein THRCLA_00623 [Thraustotheca clavata]
MLREVFVGIGALFVLRVIVEMVVNWGVRRVSGLLKDIKIDEMTRVSMNVKLVRFRMWQHLWMFVKTPSREFLLRLMVSSIEITVMKCSKIAEKRNSMLEILQFLDGMQLPTHPCWTACLPNIQRYSYLAQFVHLLNISLPKIDVKILEDGKNAVEMHNASLEIHAHLDKKKESLIVAISIASKTPLSIRTNLATINLCNACINVAIPLSLGSQQPQIPIPHEVSVSIGSLEIDLPSLSKLPSLQVSSPSLSADEKFLLLRLCNELLPNNITLSCNLFSLEVHHANHIFNATICQLILASNRELPVLNESCRKWCLEMAKICTTTDPSRPPLVAITSFILGVDAITPPSRSIAVKLSGEIKKCIITVHDGLEHWVSYASSLVCCSESKPAAPLTSLALDFQFKVIHTCVKAISRKSLPLDDPSYNAPSLEIRIDEVSVSLFPKSMIGVRSLVEIRLSRFGLWIEWEQPKHAISVDTIRLFLDPLDSILHGSSAPANVEMEAEWVQVQYSREALAAIGGLFDLIFFIAQQPLRMLFKVSKPTGSANIPSKRVLLDAFSRQKRLYNIIDFHGVVKRIIAIFPVTCAGETTLEHLSVDEMVITTDGSAKRYLIQFHSIKATTATQYTPYLTVEDFAIEETLVRSSSVVDLYAGNVNVEWNPLLQLRMLVIVQHVVLSTYNMLFQLFHAYSQFAAPNHSQYKYGVNASLYNSEIYSQCKEQLLFLLSASGDKLHRLMAEKICVSLPDYDICMRLNSFGGDDLPDLWSFGGISIDWQNETLLSIADLSARHTLDGRANYVLGEFESMLRQRRRYIIPEAPPTGEEGFLITAQGIQVQLVYQFFGPMIELGALFQNHALALCTALSKELAVYWRPQSELAHKYFTQFAEPVMPCIWLDVHDIAITGFDNPMEQWLCQMQGIWLEDQIEQEVRRQVIEEQWNSLKLTNVHMLADDSYQDMTKVRLEKNSSLYIQRVKQRPSLPPQHRIHLKIGSVSGTIHLDGDETSAIRKLRELDEATSSIQEALRLSSNHCGCFRPSFDALIAPKLDLKVDALSLELRGSTPISIQQLNVQGDTIIALLTIPRDMNSLINVKLGPKYDVQINVLQKDPKIYFDLVVTLQQASINYAPRINPILMELVQDFQRILAVFIPESIAYWDTIRAFFHGKCQVDLQDTTVRLLGLNQDYIQLNIQKVLLEYKYQEFGIHVSKLRCKIEPLGFGNILDLYQLKCCIRLDWNALSKNHYLMPREFTYLDEFHHVQKHVLMPISIDKFASKSLSLSITCSVYTSEKKEMPFILLYGKSVEWLLHFYLHYARAFSLPSRTRHSHAVQKVPLNMILNHIEFLALESIDFAGLDIALYYSDQSPLGCRWSFRDVFLSCAITKKDIKTLAESLEAHMMKILPKIVLHDVVFCLGEMHWRVCTLSTGSRGEAFVDLGQVYIDMDRTQHSPMTPTIEKQRKKIAQLLCTSEVKPKTPVGPTQQKSIMEFFEIKGDEHLLKNRTSSIQETKEETKQDIEFEKTPITEVHLDCLLCVLFNEPRVFSTLETIETLIGIGDEWFTFFHDLLPDLFEVKMNKFEQYPPACPQIIGDQTTPTEHSLMELLEQGKKREVRISSANDVKEDSSYYVPSDDFKTLVRVKLIDLQVFALGDRQMGTIVLAIPLANMTHSIDLENNTENAIVDIHRIFLFTSSLDVDVAHRQWLKLQSDGLYCESSAALLRKVIQASDPQHCYIEITRLLSTVHQVEVNIPIIDITIDMESKQILTDLIALYTKSITEKITKYKQEATAREIAQHLEPNSTLLSLSLQELWQKERNLKWDLQLLRWQETCRSGYNRERFNDSDRTPKKNSVHFRRRLSAHFSNEASTPEDPFTILLEKIQDELNKTSHAFEQVYQQYRQSQHVRPTIELSFVLSTATVLLRSSSCDILRIVNDGLALTITQFEDQSGNISCKIASLSATNLLPQTAYPELLNRAPSTPISISFENLVDMDTMIRIDAEIAAPVGGITVIQHFEVNVQPLQVCLTYDLITQCATFFSARGPSSSRRNEEDEIRNQFLAPATSLSNSSVLRPFRKAISKSIEEKPSEWNEDVAEMAQRATKNMTFKHIRLGTIQVVVNYKSSKASNIHHDHLEEMRGFDLKIHALVYTDKTCTLDELLVRIRRDIILDILSQVGRNFNNIGIFLKERLDISRWADKGNYLSPERNFQLELQSPTTKKSKKRFSFIRPLKSKSSALSPPSPSN